MIKSHLLEYRALQQQGPIITHYTFGMLPVMKNVAYGKLNLCESHPSSSSTTAYPPTIDFAAAKSPPRVAPRLGGEPNLSIDFCVLHVFFRVPAFFRALLINTLNHELQKHPGCSFVSSFVFNQPLYSLSTLHSQSIPVAQATPSQSAYNSFQYCKNTLSESSPMIFVPPILCQASLMTHRLSPLQYRPHLIQRQFVSRFLHLFYSPSLCRKCHLKFSRLPLSPS